MMLNDKASAMQLVWHDPATGRTELLDPRGMLTLHQLTQMSQKPDLLHEFCLHVADDLRRRGRPDVEIRATVLCSLNGRRPQLLVDPQADLAGEPRSLWHKPWLMPLTEPLLDDPWNIPPSQWPPELYRDPSAP
jgi:hypothetical protein